MTNLRPLLCLSVNGTLSSVAQEGKRLIVSHSLLNVFVVIHSAAGVLNSTSNVCQASYFLTTFCLLSIFVLSPMLPFPSNQNPSSFFSLHQECNPKILNLSSSFLCLKQPSNLHCTQNDTQNL